MMVPPASVGCARRGLVSSPQMRVGSRAIGRRVSGDERWPYEVGH